MASEILAVPEEKLEEVIRVIRAGIGHLTGKFVPVGSVSEETVEQLTKWCDDEEEYLKNLRSGT